ncbi:nitronate monooxygenase [Corynebacterium striatum]
MSAILKSLEIRVLPAPMAGGPTTPDIVIAAEHNGSFGALALGTASLSAAREQIEACRGHRFGVNLFHAQEPLSPANREAVGAMAQELGVSVPEADLEFGWTEKLNMALDAGAAVLWSVFGTFTEEEITCIHAAGAEAWTTVTTPAEAVEAARRGVDALCVQGPEAGGHRGVWDAEAEPDWRPLEELVFAVHAALGDAPIPLIAAGGMRSSADVERALAWPGVVAVSCGSAFLLASEAGTSPVNRELLACGGRSVSTRAFSGRYARGLETEFTRSNPQLSPLYPYLNSMLKPRRAQKDPAVGYCLVGEEVEKINGGSVAEILHHLCPNGHS